jgi:undecaprenyl-diphosphatase
MRRRVDGAPSPCQAVALGLLQGPTELLPVSSSGHTALIPWLAGWSYVELEPELRKSLEVALHAGAGAALAIDMRRELLGAARKLDKRRIAVIALSLVPAAVAGYALERPIERRLGGPRSIAAGLIAGAVAMALADLRPGRAADSIRQADSIRRADSTRRAGRRRRRGSVHEGSLARGTRHEDEAGPRDGLALGLAQAAALIPGVSRNGATLTAARGRGFAREDAVALSWHAALPVILGASALKAWRLRRRGVPDGAWAALAAGAGSAFVSTSASARLLRRPRVSARALLPCAVYRCLLACFALRRLGAHGEGKPR